MPQPVLNIITENEEDVHITENMKKTAVHKHMCEERDHTVTQQGFIMDYPLRHKPVFVNKPVKLISQTKLINEYCDISKDYNPVNKRKCSGGYVILYWKKQSAPSSLEIIGVYYTAGVYKV
jgi:hypothetical protein